MRPTGAVRAAVAAVCLLAAAGCAAGNGPYVEGPAPTVARDERPVYVSDAAGDPLQRPERFAVSEFVTLISLTWESWGGPEATATGVLRGMWCLPECEDGYPATVVLREPVRAERVAYYSRATIHAEEVPVELAPELTDIPLYRPGTEEGQP